MKRERDQERDNMDEKGKLVLVQHYGGGNTAVSAGTALPMGVEQAIQQNKNKNKNNNKNKNTRGRRQALNEGQNESDSR